MKFYEEFFSREDSTIHILEYDKINNNYIVNGNIINNNRALVGDNVEIYKNNIINIIKRSEKKITGFVTIGTSYGTNKKGKKYYKFTPFQKKYPNFRVISNIKKNGNYYSCIKFKEWNIDQNYPIGQIIYIDPNNNPYEFLLYKYDLKKSKLKNSKTLQEKIDSDLIKTNELKDYKYIGYTVDPQGSMDLDDALYNDNHTFYVFITNPLQYLNSELIDIIQNNIVSLYTHNKVINMYPDEYSNNIFSLKENSIKYCKVFIIEYNENFELINIKMENEYVKIIKNYTYEKFDKILEKNKLLQKLMEKFKINDSHKYIEYFMCLVNKYIANYLKDNLKDKEKLVYRILEENKGIYSNKTLKHNFIDDYYTHCTSPIRRYIDNYILGLIDNYHLNCDLNKINEKINKTKKYYYSLDRLKLIEKLEIQYINDNNIILEATVVKIDNKNIILKIDNLNIKEHLVNFKDYNLIVNSKVLIQVVPFFNELYYKNKLRINIIKILDY
jgi:exoribonuclease R